MNLHAKNCIFTPLWPQQWHGLWPLMQVHEKRHRKRAGEAGVALRARGFNDLLAAGPLGQARDKIGVPLQHVTTLLKVLSMVVSATNAVLVHVGELHLYPGRVKPLLMQNSRHRMPETVTGSSPLIPQQLYYLIHTFLTDWFPTIVSSNENVRVMTGYRL